jgi:hypothetical protein
MKRCGLVVFSIIAIAGFAVAQTQVSPGQPVPTVEPSRGLRLYQPRGLYQNTWYDALVHQLNPEHRNWGDWIEQRRQAFLDATVRNPYFKYSFMATMLLLLAMATCLKLYCDLSKTGWICSDKLRDAQAHDRRSRAAAREAIRRYNEHMENCNRVIEGQEAGLAVAAAAAGSDAESLHAELEETRKRLDDVTRERDRLKAELDKVKFTVADLSLKVDSLRSKGNGQPADAEGSMDVNAPAHAEMMRLISNLQQQLYAEREKNKSLKGG